MKYLITALLLASTAFAQTQLRSLQGAEVSLEDFRGKVVVASFSAHGIPLTRAELPQLQKLAKKYTDVVFLWISINSTLPTARNYASDSDLKTLTAAYDQLTVLRDPNGAVYKTFGSTALPTLIILDKQGKLAAEPIRGIYSSNLAAELEPILQKLIQ